VPFGEATGKVQISPFKGGILADDRTITQICEDCLTHDELLKGCNLFVQAVCAAKDYGDVFSKGDDADAMVGALKKPPFQPIATKGEATERANGGMLVIGGLTRQEMSYVKKDGTEVKATMGHVVVVAPGGPSTPAKIKLNDGKFYSFAGGYPYCYGGAARVLYRLAFRLSVDVVFPTPVRDHVHYAYLQVPKNMLSR
jgi:hypothetical protein